MPHFVVAVEVQGSKRRHREGWMWSVARAKPEPELAAVLASARQEAATEASSAAAVKVGIIVKVMAVLSIKVLPNRNWPSHLPIHFRNQRKRLDSGVFIMVLAWDRLGQISQLSPGLGQPLASIWQAMFAFSLAKQLVKVVVAIWMRLVRAESTYVTRSLEAGQSLFYDYSF